MMGRQKRSRSSLGLRLSTSIVLLIDLDPTWMLMGIWHLVRVIEWAWLRSPSLVHLRKLVKSHILWATASSSKWWLNWRLPYRCWQWNRVSVRCVERTWIWVQRSPWLVLTVYPMERMTVRVLVNRFDRREGFVKITSCFNSRFKWVLCFPICCLRVQKYVFMLWFELRFWYLK